MNVNIHRKIDAINVYHVCTSLYYLYTSYVVIRNRSSLCVCYLLLLRINFFHVNSLQTIWFIAREWVNHFEIDSYMILLTCYIRIYVTYSIYMLHTQLIFSLSCIIWIIIYFFIHGNIIVWTQAKLTRGQTVNCLETGRGIHFRITRKYWRSISLALHA